MFKLNIPVENKIETIVCNLYLHVDLKVHPQIPVESPIAKQHMQQLEVTLKMRCHEIAAMVCTMLEDDLNKVTTNP